MRLRKIYSNITGKIAVAALAAGLVLFSSAPVFANGSPAPNNQPNLPGFCVPFNAPVALGSGQPFNQHIAGAYCQPFAWAKGSHQIDVLTEGATYNSSYWDWPQNPALYSYVQKTLKAGRATLTYDRMGTGKSSHPVSTDITMAADAYVLHEIIQVLHLVGYNNVNSIGHSYGSGIALHEAGTYNDTSRVVLTGYLHTPRNDVVAGATYPANQDPAFAGQGLDNGYLTTKPGTRKTSFYSTAASQQVIDYDEAHKDLVSGTGFGGYFADRAVPAGTNLTNQITAPVLLIDGQQDFVFCFNPAYLDCTDESAVLAHEAPYFTGTASLTAKTVPNTGHDLTLHPSANDSFATINSWIKTH
ncbi:MAG TPA: alpha/beta hydrolase [Patescibacteria group bacterium]|nr:alpha/beta hydrolase [Patescibacteria group bacterium]